MRDPMTWSLPLGRLFGVVVRVHFLFPIMVVGLVLRAAFHKEALPGAWVETMVLVGLLFVSVFLHEFGHVFAARAVDGDAHEVLLWPLGGLASVEVPHTPRANFIAAAGGPLVNLLLALAVCVFLTAGTLLPSFRPWADPYSADLYNWSEGVWYGSKTGHGDLWQFTGFKEGNNWVSAEGLTPKNPTKGGKTYEVVPLHPDDVTYFYSAGRPADQSFFIVIDKEHRERIYGEPVPRGAWLVLASRFFWVNWFLLLLNLIPAFPLDGGRMLQCILWARSDYRQGTLVAIFCGFLMMFAILLYALVATEQILPLALAVFIYASCRRQWIMLETGGEESLFGYDFSQGYTSLEREQAPAPPKRRLNWWQRWMQKRAQKRMQREQEQREAEEKRMDELLEKVHRLGRDSLTEEERRFLARVSAKFRNRQ
jgi:stage IV sporulation protein FB